MATSLITASALNAFVGGRDTQLFSTLLKGMNWWEVYGKRTGVKNTMEMTRLKISDGLRPYNTTKNTGNSTQTFSGTLLSVAPWDRDFDFDPREYFETWMAEFQGDKNRPPFQAYLYAQYAKALQHEITDKVAYWGLGTAAYPAYNSGTAYTANSDSAGLMKFTDGKYYKCITTTTAGQTPVTHPAKWVVDNARAVVKGVGKQIADLITAATELVPVTTGTPTSSNAFDKALAVYRSMPEQFKSQEMELHVGMGQAENIVDQLSTLNQYNIKALEDLPLTLPKTNGKLKIKIMDNMTGSNRMIITVPQNIIAAVNNTSDTTSIKFVDQLKTIEGTFNGTLGFAVRDPLALFVNDAV
jgi:hypothetical protein